MSNEEANSWLAAARLNGSTPYQHPKYFSSTWIIAKTSSSERTASWCRRGEGLHGLALLASIVAHFASDTAHEEGDNDVCGLSL
jgi:hypothetical protein